MPKKDTKTSSDKKKMQEQNKVKVMLSLSRATEAIEDVIEHILGCDTEGEVEFDDYDYKFGPIVAKNVHFNGKTYPVATAITDGDSIDFRFYSNHSPTSKTIPALQKNVLLKSMKRVSLPMRCVNPVPNHVLPDA